MTSNTFGFVFFISTMLILLGVVIFKINASTNTFEDWCERENGIVVGGGPADRICISSEVVIQKDGENVE